MAVAELDLGKYQLGWSDVEDYVFKPRKGLSEEIVREMSAMKGEPGWMLEFRLAALRRFERKPRCAGSPRRCLIWTSTTSSIT